MKVAQGSSVSMANAIKGIISSVLTLWSWNSRTRNQNASCSPQT